MGLLYPNGSDFVVAMLAAARIGAVVVPFTTFATARELRQQLSDADIAILLADPAFRSHDYVKRCHEALAVDLRLRDPCSARRTAIAPCRVD